MTKTLKKALESQKKSTKKESLQISGTLGIPIGGERRVEVANRNAFVYVKLRDNQNEVIQAFNNKVAPSYGLPVIVERHGTRYVVVSVDTMRYQNNWNSFAPFLPRHGNTHSFDLEAGGGGDVVWVQSRQIVPALVFPSGSLGGPNVLMHPYTLRNNDGSWKYVGNTGTSSLLPYKPTGSSAVMVLVYLDVESGNPYLMVGSGSYFSATITGSAAVLPYVPSTSNPNHLPLAAIRLVSGSNVLSWNNIYDVRQWIHPISTGTSGGGTLTIQDEGVSQGTATTLNFVGDNVQATVSGGIARIFITGSNSGGTGSFDNTYLRLDATNDPLTGKLSIIPTTYGTDGLYVETRGDTYTADFEQRATGTTNISSPIIYLHRSPLQGSPTFDAAMIEADQIPLAGTIDGGTASFLKYTYYNKKVFEVLRDGLISSKPTYGVGGWSFEVVGNSPVFSGNHFSPSGTDLTGNTFSGYRLQFMGTEVLSGTFFDFVQTWPTGYISSGRLLRFRSNNVERVSIDPSASSTGTNVMFDGDFSIGVGGNLLLLKNQGSPKWRVDGSGYLEFGLTAAKESNAGKLGYDVFGNGYFDIVGAGTTSLNRWVRIYDNLKVDTHLQTSSFQNLGLVSHFMYLNATGTFVSPVNAPDQTFVTGSFSIFGLDAAFNSVRFSATQLINDVGTPGNGWIQRGETWTRTGNYTFTVPGNMTSIYRKGAKVKYVDSGNTEYGVIASSSFGSGVTTVTLITNTDYTMAGNPSSVYISYLENPEGFPTEFNWTPTHSRSTTNYTNAPTTTFANWRVVGGKLFFKEQHQQNATPAGSGYQKVSLPVVPNSTAATGRNTGSGMNISSAYGLVVFIAENEGARIFKYDGTQEAVASHFYFISGEYEF